MLAKCIIFDSWVVWTPLTFTVRPAVSGILIKVLTLRVVSGGSEHAPAGGQGQKVAVRRGEMAVQAIRDV